MNLAVEVVMARGKGCYGRRVERRREQSERSYSEKIKDLDSHRVRCVRGSDHHKN